MKSRLTINMSASGEPVRCKAQTLVRPVAGPYERTHIPPKFSCLPPIGSPSHRKPFQIAGHFSFVPTLPLHPEQRSRVLQQRRNELLLRLLKLSRRARGQEVHGFKEGRRCPRSSCGESVAAAPLLRSPLTDPITMPLTITVGYRLQLTHP